MRDDGGMSRTERGGAARWLALLAGLLTGLSGLGVALAATSLLGERLSPLTAVSETVIDLTPGKIAHLLVSVVGQNDKPLLRAGTLVGLLLLAAVAGRLGLRSTLRGQVVFLAMGVLAAICMLNRPGTDPASLIPVVAGLVTWLVALPPLLDALRASGATEPAVEDGPGPDAFGAPAGRRTFLVRAGLVGGLAVVGGVLGGVLGRKRREVEASIASLDLPVSAGTVPAGADLGIEDLAPFRTPNSDFYLIDTAIGVPAIRPEDWSLRIHGLVDREIRLSYDDLIARQLTGAWVTLCCVSNGVGGPLVGNAYWSGVRIADLLREAGVKPGADAILQTSEDGWTCGTPIQAVTDDRDALLAVAMNGKPLPVEHGFPVRMVVPGLYGFVSATKWLVDIEVSRFDRINAFWTERGWAEKCPIKTQSRIDVPRANHRVSAGTVQVAGVAWAQHLGIEKVEVQLDGKGWQEVRLARVPSVDTWVQWEGEVDVDPGVHKLTVRATDRDGRTQTSVRTDVIPDGASGWHSIEFTAE
jgi:DMSO/TMAO reductase YedYZ molybdopterin-dependent catalytic subunit